MKCGFMKADDFPAGPAFRQIIRDPAAQCGIIRAGIGIGVQAKEMSRAVVEGVETQAGIRSAGGAAELRQGGLGALQRCGRADL